MSKVFLDIQSTIKCGFTMKRVLEMTRAYSQMHRADNYSEDSLTIYPVWPNRWVFIYKLSDSGFESSCCHSQSFADFAAASSKEFLDIQKTAECGFTLKRLVTWHKPIVKFNVQISTHNTAQSFGQFSQMVEWFLQTKSFWVRVQLQSLNLQISRLLRARSSLKSRQL